MNSATLAVIFSAGALAIGGALVTLRRTGEEDKPASPSELPGFGELDRDSREQVIRDAVVLATELARVDDYIAPSEVDSVRDFIFSHVAPHQVAEITEAMRAGMNQPASPAAVSAACARIREGYDLVHRELVVHFLVHVAHSDGLVCPEERGYLERIVVDLGVREHNLQVMLDAYAKWVKQQDALS